MNFPARTPFGRGRQRKYVGYNTAKLPSGQELADQAHDGAEADRNSLFTVEQIAEETRTVRLDVSFTDPIKIRDQCEMLIEACQIIIEKTRDHDIGSIRQRIDCRREAASLGRALARFNGKTSRGDYARRPKKP